MADYILHKNATRGHANHGWLDSHHSFSFAGYYDEARMNFGLLRVLNDDIVIGGMGFGKHPHDNMEIVSIPLSGSLEHKDSTGRHEIIKTGDVQIMSAGSGIAHSEFNASKSEAVNFLQIWVFPKERNIEPRYEQKNFSKEDRLNKIQTVVSPKKEDGGVWINQDAWFSLSNLQKGNEVQYTNNLNGNGVYVFVISGEINVNGQTVQSRDGLGITNSDKLNITANSDSEFLLIEVPMKF
ncbi:MAG: hypothetical protein C5B52_11220 [Bacteroidetes bacterium]|nr:MAG: hypothetical protein C5B52_11220 [Bacteroidota bacterium]